MRLPPRNLQYDISKLTSTVHPGLSTGAYWECPTLGSVSLTCKAPHGTDCNTHKLTHSCLASWRFSTRGIRYVIFIHSTSTLQQQQFRPADVAILTSPSTGKECNSCWNFNSLCHLQEVSITIALFSFLFFFVLFLQLLASLWVFRYHIY